MNPRLALALAALCGGCTAMTEFDTASVVEDSAALCTDGADNDGNGLTDCQDWGCLNQDACCTIPALALADDFEDAACATQACDGAGACEDGLNPERWQIWGAPEPTVCEGALVPGKREQCFDVGALSRDAFPLAPGLVVTAEVSGQPEVRGHLRLALTFQREVVGSRDPCAPIEPLDDAIAIEVVSDEVGYRLVAIFDREQVGVSEPILTSGQRQIQLEIRDDGRVHYLVDGTSFGVSPERQRIPETASDVRVALAGRGDGARFEEVSVVVGSLCDKPSQWFQDAAGALALEPSTALEAWDNFSVGAPAAVGASGGYQLYYAACAERRGRCDTVIAGLGVARGVDSGEFERIDSCPLIGPEVEICEGGLSTPFPRTLDGRTDVAPLTVGERALGFVSLTGGGPWLGMIELGPDAAEMAEMTVLTTGPPGAWDSAAVCCASAVERDGEIWLYYAGRAEPDGPWRIGLARSSDGRSFVRSGAAPVFAEGAPGSFDDRGVGAPSVVYDAERDLYRMWYAAAGFLGVSSIGYAVSADGVTWSRFPGNPALRPEDLGLVELSAPFVVAEVGRDRMWIEGSVGDRPGSQIYQLRNTGAEPLADDEP